MSIHVIREKFGGEIFQTDQLFTLSCPRKRLAFNLEIKR
jgi:hypothetical protein